MPHLHLDNNQHAMFSISIKEKTDLRNKSPHGELFVSNLEFKLAKYPDILPSF